MTQADEQAEYHIIAEFYDHIVPYRTREDVDFFVDIAREANGPVLEAGCGTGRVLIPTARAGIEIVGLDPSQPMLDQCRKNLEREPKDVQARVQLVHGDMRDFHIGREFALATTPFRSFQHVISVDDQLAALRCIHRHLANGGGLVLDLFNPDLTRLADEDYLSYEDVEPEFTMPDGRTVIRTARNLGRNLLEQTVDIELAHHVTHPDGREETLSEQLRLRYFFRFEIEHLLARAGFTIDRLYADYDRSPLGSKEPGELLFVAKKV